MKEAPSGMKHFHETKRFQVTLCNLFHAHENYFQRKCNNFQETTLTSKWASAANTGKEPERR